MIAHRPWESLESADLGWLRAKHHFRVDSSGNPAHHALGPLIVWNDDEIAVGRGFALHGHHDVEIITYVRQGVLGHRDTLGSEGTIQAGDIQVMSAGTGIRHAEVNRGQVPLKIYQIWLQPREIGGVPRWETRAFPKRDRYGHFAVLASGFAEDKEALPIRADARLLGAMMKSGEGASHQLGTSSDAYLAVASGRVEVNGEVVGPLGGVAITAESAVEVSALEDAEVLLVETR